jgi:hypothetical protein
MRDAQHAWHQARLRNSLRMRARLRLALCNARAVPAAQTRLRAGRNATACEPNYACGTHKCPLRDGLRTLYRMRYACALPYASCHSHPARRTQPAVRTPLNACVVCLRMRNAQMPVALQISHAVTHAYSHAYSRAMGRATISQHPSRMRISMRICAQWGGPPHA